MSWPCGDANTLSSKILSSSHTEISLLFFAKTGFDIYLALLLLLKQLAQMDARPTCDQEVASSTPTRSSKFFRGD